MVFVDVCSIRSCSLTHSRCQYCSALSLSLSLLFHFPSHRKHVYLGKSNKQVTERLTLGVYLHKHLI